MMLLVSKPVSGEEYLFQYYAAVSFHSKGWLKSLCHAEMQCVCFKCPVWDFVFGSVISSRVIPSCKSTINCKKRIEKVCFQHSHCHPQ